MFNFARFLSIALFLTICSACSEQSSATPTGSYTSLLASTPTTSSAAPVSYTKDVFPILESRCLNCHGGDRTEEGLLMRTYQELMAGSKNGPVIVSGNATDSLLVELFLNVAMLHDVSLQ